MEAAAEEEAIFLVILTSVLVLLRKQLLRLPLVLAGHRTLILYFCIGASAALIDLGLFIVSHSLWQWSSPLATLFSISVATVYAFLLNSFYNFGVTDRFWLRLLSYSAVSGMGLLFSVAWLTLFNVILGVDGNLCKIVSLPFIFVLQYWLNKRITFRQ